MSILFIGPSPIYKIQKNDKKIYDISDLSNLDRVVKTMERPRTAVSFLESGRESKNTVYTLSDMLTTNDTVIDISNDHFMDSLKKEFMCRKNGLGYLGIGMSSSPDEPTLMVGGDLDTFNNHHDILYSISPNVVHVTEDAGSGNFTKMVHDAMEQAMIDCLVDIFSYCKYSKTEFESAIYYALQTSANGKILRNALNVSRNAYSLDENDEELPSCCDSSVWCTRLALDEKIIAPVITSSVFSRIHKVNNFENSYCTVTNNVMKEEEIAGTISFVFASIILEGCNLIRSYDIPVDRGKLAWKKGSDVDSELLNLGNGQLEKIKRENAHHARKLCTRCISQEIPAPVVCAAVQSLHYV